MPSVSIADLQSYAERVAGDRHDSYSRDSLARAVEEYAAQRREPIGAIRPVVGGTSYPSLYSAFEDPAATFTDAEMVLVDPPSAGPAWDWTLPFQRFFF